MWVPGKTELLKHASSSATGEIVVREQGWGFSEIPGKAKYKIRWVFCFVLFFAAGRFRQGR